MNHFEIATQTGVLPGDLEWLTKGKITAAVAQRLGVTMGDVEDFIRGSVSAAMTRRLGLTTISAAEELARVCGQNAAIGIILGILFWDAA